MKEQSPQAAWRDRIVGEGNEAPDQLLANPLNFRRHPKHQQEAMTGALDAIGVIQRVIVNKRTGNLVDGHLRVELAMRSSQPTIPVLYVDLSEEEEKLALATLDPIGALAETDREILGQLLSEINTRPTQLQFLLDDLAKSAGGTIATSAHDPNAAPPPRAKATRRLGDMWLLGRHRLLVGDATRTEDYTELLCKEMRFDCLWTDPPYNVDYEGKAGKITNDKQAAGAFDEFLQASFGNASATLKDGACFYVAHADSNRLAFELALRAAGLVPRQNLIWVKNAAVLSRQDYNWRHEPVLYGWKDGAGHYFGQDFTNNTVFDKAGADVHSMPRKDLEALALSLLSVVPTTAIHLNRPQVSAVHPTMKPVELVERMVSNSTRPEETVLDPFAGSGTTAIACERLGRRARMLELDPVYADVIVTRWQEFTEQDATLYDGGDATFAQVAEERRAEARVA